MPVLLRMLASKRAPKRLSGALSAAAVYREILTEPSSQRAALGGKILPELTSHKEQEP